MHVPACSRSLRFLCTRNSGRQHMDNLYKEVTPLLTFLLPGFLSASIFYGFTSHPKPSQFERTVEALVFTFVVHAVTRMIEAVLEALGRIWSVGEWTSTSQLTCSVLIATALGADGGCGQQRYRSFLAEEEGADFAQFAFKRVAWRVGFEPFRCRTAPGRREAAHGLAEGVASESRPWPVLHPRSCVDRR